MSDTDRVELNEPIAIVGIAAELPSGPSDTNLDYRRFNKFLLDGAKSYVRIPKDRLNIDSWQGHGLGRIATSHGSFLKNVESFDHVEFGISTKDARAMSLSTRKLIELSFLALLDSGIDYRGKDVGCYTSATNHDILSVAEPDVYEARGSFGGIPCMVANKISYHLDLRGPSIPVDTACSSSLTASHLAVQALRAGECESAVVAACQLNLRLADFVQYSQASVLSKDGKCKPFDADADGFSRGEGAVAIVLKPLSAALRDGDHIYANMLGTGLSASGSLAPVHAPAATAQLEAMKRAYRGTGRDPREVDYVELHATGTAAGDPTESNWVGEHFARDAELLVGSVKGNIGHLEVTAFLASLCKVCGMFETGIVPPNVNLRTRNPAIRWDTYKLNVPLEPTEIRPRGPSQKLLVSMCSSGIGGANGHAVLESMAPSRPEAPASHSTPQDYPRLLMAGGLSPTSAASVADSLRTLATGNPDSLTTISAMSGRRIRQMNWRSFAVIQPAQGLAKINFPAPALAQDGRSPLVFLFSGQGPQHFAMGRQLIARFEVFRKTIEELDGYHMDSTGTSLIRDTGLFGEILSSNTLPPVWPISVILPSLAMLQIALFDLLISLGLRPDVVMGHSAGETPLLYASAAASKRLAMEVAIVRGKAMSLVEEADGGMAALSCAPYQADEIIKCAKEPSEDGVLEIACFNGPQAVAIAGHRRLIARAVDIATSRGILARTIQTNVAVHSSMMDICRDSYCSGIADAFARFGPCGSPNVTTFSTATGDLLEGFSSDYFWQNSRGPVRFAQTVRSVLRAYPAAQFVEISPHAVLSVYLQDLGVPPSSVVCPMRRSKTYAVHQEHTVLLTTIGQLAASGYNGINFRALNSIDVLDHDAIQLPPYPFLRKPVPYLPRYSRLLQKQLGHLVRPLSGDGLRVNRATHPELAQHVINHEPIMPAAGFLEMALEAGASIVWNVHFRSFFSLAPDVPTALKVDINGMHWQVLSSTDGGVVAENNDQHEPRMHAEGFMTRDPHGLVICEGFVLSEVLQRAKLQDADNFYSGFHHFAQYGPLFSRIRRYYFGSSYALVELEGLDEASLSNYIIHPGLLDACIHVLVHPRFTANWDSNVYYLPSALGSLAIRRESSLTQLLRGTLYAYVVLTEWSPDEIAADVHVVSAEGQGICTLRDLKVTRHYVTSPTPVSKRFQVISQPLSMMKPLRRSRVAYFADSESTLHNGAQLLLRELLGPTVTVVYQAGVMDKNEPLSRKMVRIQAGASRTHRSMFDIVLCRFSAPWSNEEATIAIQSCVSSLIPGGFLFVQSSCNMPDPQSSCHDSSDLCFPPADLAVLQLELNNMGFRTRVRGLPTILIEAQSPSLSLASPKSPRPESQTQVLRYRIGKEIDIQSTLAKLDVNGPACIWVIAPEGCDGDGATGFTRSLRRELPVWDIGLLVTSPTFSERESEDLAHHLSSIPWIERELYIGKDHQLHVRRIREVPPFRPGRTISYHGDIPPRHIRLDRTLSYSIDSRYHCLAGRVAAAPDDATGMLVGTRVVTITTEPPEEDTTVHQDAVTPLPDHWEEEAAPVLALSCLVMNLALKGESTRDYPARNDSRRIVVVGADTPLGHTLVHILQQLGICSVRLQLDVSPLDIASLRLGPVDTVVALSSHASTILATFADSGFQLVRMCDISRLMGEVTRSPRLLTTMLQNTIQSTPSVVSSSGQLPRATPDRPSRPLLRFKPHEVYVLIGGIGSLGMHIALWMYERGARTIVLTSRSGRRSLERAGDVLAIHILGYLESRTDLALRLEACDAASLNEMRVLLSGLKKRIAGCMLLSGVLVDRTFFSQDASTFEATFRPKYQAMRALEGALPVNDLDFLIVFSSISSFGNAGQTNYSRRGFLFFANTTIEGQVMRYSNAFALVTPAIVDSTAIGNALSHQEQGAQLAHLLPWALSARELCDCIEDGILMLQHGPVGVYVPNLNWDLVRQHMGPSHLYDHLSDFSPRAGPTTSLQQSREDLLSVVLQHLDVPADAFSPDALLSQYGMDSLSAGRLSFALKTVVSVSSMQLLGGLSFAELHRRATTTHATLSGVSNTHGDNAFDWAELSRPGQPLVKLVDRQGDTPLILVHGANGSVITFLPFQQTFTSSLWVLQSTSDTPMHSLDAIAEYYYNAIKDAQPNGPYRIGAYSGTSIIAFLIAERVISDGETVVQFCLLDHFPLLFASPYLEPDAATVQQRSPSHAFMIRVLDSMLSMYKAEQSLARQQLAQEFEDAARGVSMPPAAALRWLTYSSVVRGSYEFMFELLPHGVPYTLDLLRHSLAARLRAVQVPLTLFVATRGILTGMSREAGNAQEWNELGVREAYPDASVVFVEGTHFTMRDSTVLVDKLQSW
ncbi:uncharacterized protein B0H18DRAFT_1188403 [Fomitopsis serialis]|uniref:uncharacterized protein n=1 Tax=Fomitopsis serialis TaxID=139415 RepID=UPI0020085830|nr:uncharacterized protein B0H18DRAFT_1188403 [Neoantrodia serialis]KAH9934350.1 hypothetical protein B0H18DRAFT_1188403 [Neoantrodia serialis]